MVRKCSNCGETVEDKSIFCPKCGNYLNVAPPKRQYPIKWILIAVIVLILIIAGGAYLLNHMSKTDTTLTMISNSNLDSGEYVVQLKDANNNILANQFISVEFNNQTYKLLTDANGTAHINLTGSGSIEVKSYFEGNGFYNDAHSSDTVVK